MRAARAVLLVAGTGVLGYGGWLLWGQIRWTPDFLVPTGAWLFAGPLAHDLLAAPAGAAVGLLLARALPGRWRTAVTAGLSATAVLFLVGVPVLTRPMPAPRNPGLDDRDYLPGLLLFLAVGWAALLAATAAVQAGRRARARRRRGAGRRAAR